MERTGENAATHRTPKRRRLPHIAVFALVVLVTSAGGAYRVWIHPWRVLPASDQEIEAAWAQVRQWAESGTGEVELEEARRAARLLRGHDVSANLRAHAPGLPTPEQLRPVEKQAVAALLGWSEAPTIASTAATCSDTEMPMPELLYLGQLALASGRADPESSELRAAVRLSQYLRERGGLLEAMMGASLAETTMTWADDRSVALPEKLLERLAIREADFFSILARGVYCLVEQTAHLLGDDPSSGLLPVRQSWRFFDPKRELLVTKAWHAEMLRRTHAHRDDLAKLVAELHYLEEKPLPKSLLLEVLYSPYASMGTRWATYAKGKVPVRAADSQPVANPVNARTPSGVDTGRMR